jgi:hypothetical protein
VVAFSAISLLLFLAGPIDPFSTVRAAAASCFSISAQWRKDASPAALRALPAGQDAGGRADRVASMSATPPGWYDDGRGARRWWDGDGWTEHVQQSTPFPAPTAASVQAPSPTAYTLAGDETADSATRYSAPVAPSGGPTGPAVPIGYPSIPPAAPKSNLWILWTVLGVVALGAVITAIIVIPMVLAGLTATTGSAGEEQPGSGVPSEGDQSAAVASVELYDEAWQQVDCDKYFAATTEAFRAELELPDCATFQESAQGFADATEEYVVTVTNVVQDADVITVSTSETYTSLVDEDGAPLENPTTVEDLWDYYLIESGDGWVIDDAGTE